MATETDGFAKRIGDTKMSNNDAYLDFKEFEWNTTHSNGNIAGVCSNKNYCNRCHKETDRNWYPPDGSRVCLECWMTEYNKEEQKRDY
jgi:recombinational DNA repair protein (RecF pathway)